MRNPISKLWPCIGEEGLNIFAATADQRYLLGKETFISTHFPVSLRRFRPGNSVEYIQESDILNTLLSHRSDTRMGNRVLVLYGAAGSGKSEMIRWLQLKMEQRLSRRKEVIIRIPRTDLDVLRIIERFQHLLSKNYFTEATHVRWEEARRKPRTLAKLLLLTALERTIESDELVNALYYRLLEWIQPRISRILSAVDIDGSKNIMPVEVLTREDLEQLIAETSLPAPLDYEQFRYHLLLAFRENLLEGIHLPTILKLISDDLSQQGKRPILLIDDLVQSINLFATDLLDYFITLENGNWDVVIGITPDAMTESKRGRELLDRITYLDTVDDRVEKLWLSDLRGSDSYFLSIDNCVDFAALYLTSFRAQNGWECNSCRMYQRCKILGSSNHQHPAHLAPFNYLLLQRIFKSLPENKGKARQYLLRLKEIMNGFIESQDLISTLTHLIPPEVAVDADDSRLARLAELYSPVPSDGKIILSASFLKAMGIPGKDVALEAQSLQRTEDATFSYSAKIIISDNDPARTAIKSWLDGKQVNRQSLLALRRGIARWLRMTCYSNSIHAHGIATPHQVLKPRKVYLGITPPILLEGIDDGLDGIRVERTLGLNAFLYQEYAASQGEVKNNLFFKIANTDQSGHLIYQANAYQEQLHNILENRIHMPLPQFAFMIYLWSIIFQRENPEETIPGLDYKKIKEWRKQIPIWISFPDTNLINWSLWLFEDFFKLRENLFDGPSIIDQMNIQMDQKRMLSQLEMLEPGMINADYYFGDYPLRDVLVLMQNIMQQSQHPLSATDERSRIQIEAIEALNRSGRKGVPFSKFPLSIWEELGVDQPDIFSTLKIVSRP